MCTAKVAYILLIMIIGGPIFSQKINVIAYQYTLDYDPNSKIDRETKYENLKNPLDTLKLKTYISEGINSLILEGYAVHFEDKYDCRNDTCFVAIYKGRKYSIGEISINESDRAQLEKSGMIKYGWEKRKFEPMIFQTYLKKIVEKESNNGYPFAQANIDSIHIAEDKIYGVLKVKKGKKIVFDNIILEGTLNLNKKLLPLFLDIKAGETYDHSKVIKAKTRLQNLQYGKLNSDPVVNFTNDKASLILNMSPKPSSRFDFLIGILPQVTTSGRKINLMVDFTTELNNNFGRGEYIFLQFRRLRPENTDLQIKSNLPYLFGTPAGTHVDFRLFKNNNLNLDLFFDGGFQYLFSGFNNIRLFGSVRSSRLLEVNVDAIRASGRLPSRLDVVTTGGGVGITIRNLDYRFNPKRGLQMDVNTTVGRRKILSNRSIEDIEGFSTAYDSLSKSSLQADLDLSIAYYIPANSWSSIRLAATSAIRYNQQGIVRNDYLRLGGNKTLRGFDEESILADYYYYATLEYRIILDQNSYFTLPFIDFGYTHVLVDDVPRLDQVLGIGMGLNIGTAAGIFNLAFAAGRNLGNPLDFNQLKIHFGYVSLF